MVPAMKLTLKEIWKLGIKIVNKEGNKVVITPEQFQSFWRRVNEFTFVINVGGTLQPLQSSNSR